MRSWRARPDSRVRCSHSGSSSSNGSVSSSRHPSPTGAGTTTSSRPLVTTSSRSATLYITAEAEAFVKWHAGQVTWAQAIRENRIQIDGATSLVKAFPTWNARSMFAHIRPVSRTATNAAG